MAVSNQQSAISDQMSVVSLQSTAVLPAVQQAGQRLHHGRQLINPQVDPPELGRNAVFASRAFADPSAASPESAPAPESTHPSPEGHA
jgi:hypothetical protein